MRHRRVWIASLLFFGVLLGLAISRVSAAESRQGDECIVDADETIDSDFYVACNTLTIEGVIEGDLIGGAWAATVAPGGHVEGDIWLIGGQLRLDGAVGDDVHFMGVDLDLTESAELADRVDISAVALNVEIWERATLPGDLLVLGYQTIVRGDVQGDVSFNGSALVIEGAVDGDVYAKVGGGDTSPSFIPFPFPFSVSFQTPGLTVRSAGRIGGDLSYTGPRPGNINGRIGGTINFDLVAPRPDITQAAMEAEEVQPLDVIARYLNHVLTDVLSLMAAGVMVMALAPAWIREPAALLPRQAPSSFGWGLILALLAAPVSLILLLVSILALIILSLITLGGFTGMGVVLLIVVNALVIGGMTFVILFMSRLVISDLIGRRLGKRLIRTPNRVAAQLLSLLLGTIVYTLVTNVPLPWVGVVINAVGVFIGLGAIALHARQLYQRIMRSSYPEYAGEADMAAHPLAVDALLGTAPEPPPDSSDLPGPGLANLPPGFDWWGEDGDESAD